MHRIHDFIITDKAEIASMFRPFDSSLTILDFSLMKESMSNTGYAVTTNAGKYFSEAVFQYDRQAGDGSIDLFEK